MKRSLLPLLLIAGSTILWVGCQTQAQTASEINTIAVKTADVVQEARVLPISTSGRLTSKAEVSLSFKTPGFIETIFVDEGARVQQGQLLAKLDLAEINAQVQQAEAGFAKAQRDLDRVEALYRDSVATLEQFQDAETALEIATSALEIASFNQTHSEIRAPANGRILRRMAEDNELVNPGQPILTLGSSKEGWVVRVGLSDRDVVKLRLNDTANLHFDAYPSSVFSGNITEVAEAADPMTGTFEVEITITDPAHVLKSGFIARVDLMPSEQEPFYLIPIEAVTEGNGKDAIIYAAERTGDAYTARRYPVRIAHILNDEVAIQTGLENIASVVTEGAPYLADGSPIRIVE